MKGIHLQLLTNKVVKREVIDGAIYVLWRDK